ncbi:6736_t:CDS:1, partial [Dentiscutata erythropus]
WYIDTNDKFYEDFLLPLIFFEGYTQTFQHLAEVLNNVGRSTIIRKSEDFNVSPYD